MTGGKWILETSIWSVRSSSTVVEVVSSFFRFYFMHRYKTMFTNKERWWRWCVCSKVETDRQVFYNEQFSILAHFEINAAHDVKHLWRQQRCFQISIHFDPVILRDLKKKITTRAAIPTFFSKSCLQCFFLWTLCGYSNL
jgi:hypothetical protein